MKHHSSPHAVQPWESASIEARESLLAPYAMRSAQSAGRKHPELTHPYRGPFQRDRDRIVHSSAYRRLSYKTQVFTGDVSDYHRSRLTHTLECSSIARTLARALAVNEDLVEALALAHDIGHPPFGHAGEDTLDECLSRVGGFNHNGQALRIVEQLETRYPEFPGLNLSLEVLEGQMTRVDKNGPGPRPLLEAQIVDAADSIAYDTHDADDALELGLLTLGDLEHVPLWAEATRRVRARFIALEVDPLRRAVIHELVDWQVGDLLTTTRARILEGNVDSVAAVRQSKTLALPSDEMASLKRELEALLTERVYRHPDVMRLRAEVQSGLKAMFDYYTSHVDQLPLQFQRRIEIDDIDRAVGDFLASLTDRAAQRLTRQLSSV